MDSKRARLLLDLPDGVLTNEMILLAYRARAFQCHPDKNPNFDAQQFADIVSAKEFLLSPKPKKSEDMLRFRRAPDHLRFTQKTQNAGCCARY